MRRSAQTERPPDAKLKLRRQGAGMDRNDEVRARRFASYPGNGRVRVHEPDEVPIGELLKRLSDDAGLLVREELDLAKTELRESAKRMGQAASQLGVALGLAIPGMLAIATFLIILLGDALNNYWLSALIVGVVFLGIAAMLAGRAKAHLQRGKIVAAQTAETLRQDAEWAKTEVQAFKRELKA
jgi:uncharacterized membrane protein YqjE